MLSIPGSQDSIWQGRISFQPASAHLFLKYLNRAWASMPWVTLHRRHMSRTNCCSWNWCLLNNALLLYWRSPTQHHIRSRGLKKTYYVICLWNRKQHFQETSNSPYNPIITSWLINEPSVWWQTPPNPKEAKSSSKLARNKNILQSKAKPNCVGV